MEKIYAPFEEKIVKALNEWQQTGYVHLYTCGTKEKHKRGDDDVLIPTRQGWKCPSCNYTQNWAHKPH